MPVLVLTVDQRASRTDRDRIPELIAALAGLPFLRGFERTAGDELQGVLEDPTALAPTLEVLLRGSGWNIGIGAGPVELPLPDSARAGRGPAYLRAREAVTAAKNSPWRLRVVGPQVGARAVPAVGVGSPARQLESALWLWAAVLARRTPRGWEVADLVDQGLSYDEVGRRLGISQSAVSQRAQAAGIAEGRRARELVTHLTADLLATGGAAEEQT